MGALILLLGASVAPAHLVPPPPSSARRIADQGRDEQPASIGTATMLADGSTVLYLIARDRGIVGHGQITYAPGDTQYTAVLKHLRGLRPGETKSVPPWPDK